MLGQAGEREVRRGTPTHARLGAVRDDVPQRRGELVGRPGDRLLAVPSGRVLHGQRQAVGFDPAHHVEEVGAFGGRVDVGVESAGYGVDEPVAAGVPVELAEVVEADLRL